MKDALQRARAEIDRVDAGMKGLFEARMAAVREILDEKNASGLPIRDPEREAAVKEARLAGMEEGIVKDSYEKFLSSVMDISVSAQEKIRASQSPDTLWISGGRGGYPVVIRRGLLGELRGRIGQNRKKLLVTDEGIPGALVNRILEQFPGAVLCRVPVGEACKTPDGLLTVWSALLDGGFCRSDCVIALGGGSVSDLAGFAAATYQRGLDCYLIPTTLLSALDASVGGKTAVDFGGVKNAVGCFSDPGAVWIDPEALDTLPRRQLVSGFAEAIKVGLTSDAELFEIFRAGKEAERLDEVIRRAVSVKASVVERDREDRGIRRILNFGHTVGHALEACLGASEAPLLHGECVALGMLPVVPEGLRRELLNIYRRIGLPDAFPADPEDFLGKIFADKKRSGGEIDTVWVREPGKCEIVRMTVPDFCDSVRPVIGQLR